MTNTSALPVIAVAGLAIEASTFSPARTDARAFRPARGNEIINRYNQVIGSSTSLGKAAQWHGALIGHALPGGMVTRSAFEELASELLCRLETLISTYGKLDGLWYDIHGAMSVEGLDDAETLLLKRIRCVIGSDTLVFASMDPHGNVSAELVHNLDLLTCYRTSPHIDEAETAHRACRNLVKALAQRQSMRGSGQVLYKAWIPVPILLPGEQTSTRDEPAKTIYNEVVRVESLPGVMDASAWVGYPWADEPRNKAAIVVTGYNEHAVASGAERLARTFWRHRKDFHFVAPTGTLDECLDQAMRAKARPFFISDSGDNPTAGGAGDVTWSLGRLLSRPDLRKPKLSVIYASIPGPEAVHMAVAAGLGAEITVVVGAQVDDTHSGPLTICGTVHAINHEDPYAGIEVVIEVGGIFIIVTQFRKPYHKESDFLDLNLQPREMDIVVVKIGYLEPELFAMAADWMLALTPGGVDQDLSQLGHRRIERPMFPLDDMGDDEPDLRARLMTRCDGSLG